MMGVAFLVQAVVAFFFGIFATQFVVLALRRWHPVRVVSMATLLMLVVWSLASRTA